MPINQFGWYRTVDKEVAFEYDSLLGDEPGARRCLTADQELYALELHLTHLPLLPGWSPRVPKKHRGIQSVHDEGWVASLWPEQVTGAAQLRWANGGLLCDDLGKGKTRTSLAAADLPCILLTPKKGVGHWFDELEEARLTCRRLTGTTVSVEDAEKALAEDVDVWLMTYQSASAWLPHFGPMGSFERPIRTILCDEGHYLQKRMLEWTQALHAIERCRTVIITGTPKRNRMRSLWPLLDLATYGAFGGEFVFREAYCGCVQGAYGYVDTETPPDKMERLRRRLEPVLVKRGYDPENDARPPIDRRAVMLDIPASTVVNEILESYREVVEDRFVREGGRSGQHLTVQTKARQRLGVLKATHAVGYIAKAALDWSRIVVWFWHKDVARLLAERLKQEGLHVEVIHGETSQKKSDRITREWKRGELYPEPPRVLLASLGACSSVVSFTSCAYQVFVEMDWAPLNMIQAEKRLHRTGQRNEEVVADYLMIRGSMDDTIGHALMAKITETDELFGPDENSDIIRTLLGRSEEKTDREFMNMVADKLRRKSHG